jgi:hypothetical protein
VGRQTAVAMAWGVLPVGLCQEQPQAKGRAYSGRGHGVRVVPRAAPGVIVAGQDAEPEHRDVGQGRAVGAVEHAVAEEQQLAGLARDLQAVGAGAERLGLLLRVWFTTRFRFIE